MKITNMEIVNAYTDIDDMMKNGNGPIKLLTPEQIFEMGQFHQWASTLVSNDALDLDAKTDIPEHIDWVVGETQGW